jgi:hypothetical protein
MKLAAHPRQIQRLWNLAKVELLPEWILERPGSRPSTWWRFDAPPEHRIFIGGGGAAADQVLAYAPQFYRGLPVNWADFQEGNPPRFESECAYLRRHNLLVASELKVLKAADYDATEALDANSEAWFFPIDGPDKEGCRQLERWDAEIRERIKQVREEMNA